MTESTRKELDEALKNEMTLNALKESISHWERLASGMQDVGEEPYYSDCALCETFDKNDNNCAGCPVRIATGERDCEGSPYYEAQQEWERGDLFSPDFRKAAKVQLKFLQSLLPKKGKV